MNARKNILTLISGLYFGIVLILSGLPSTLFELTSSSSTALSQHHRNTTPSHRKIHLKYDKHTTTTTLLRYYIVTLSLTISAFSTLIIYLFNKFSKQTPKISPRTPSTYQFFTLNTSSSSRNAALSLLSSIINSKYNGNVIGGVLQGIGMKMVQSEPGLIFVGLGRFILRFVKSRIPDPEISSDGNDISKNRVLGNRDDFAVTWVVLGGVIGGFAFVMFDEWMKGRKEEKLLSNTRNAATKFNESKTEMKMDGKEKKHMSSTVASAATTTAAAKRQISNVDDNHHIKSYRPPIFLLYETITITLLISLGTHSCSSFSSTTTTLSSFFSWSQNPIKDNNNKSTDSTEQQQQQQQQLCQLWKNAIFAGILVSSSQLMSIILTGGTLGVSSVYPVIAKHVSLLLDRLSTGSSGGGGGVTGKKGRKTNPGYTSIFFALGVVFSSGFTSSMLTASTTLADLFLSTEMKESWAGRYDGRNPSLPFDHIHHEHDQTWRAVLAGFLMIFGARLAGGCTSGHGISGCGTLSVSSFVTVGAMIVPFIFS